MSRNSNLRSVLFVGASVLFLSGCAADYLSHYDTVTLAAGDAQKHNQLLQTKDPFNPESDIERIETSGERAADAVKKYEDSQKPGAQPPQNVTINIAN